MLRITSLLFLSPLLAGAFTVNHAHISRHVALHMSTTVDDINLVLNGNNIDLTDSLADYVEKRIGGPLRKLGGGGIVRECDVHLSVYKNPKVKNAHRVDLTANLKGLTIHCKEESPASALQSKLQKYRSRRNDGHHAGNSMGDDLMAALDKIQDDLEAATTESDEDEFVDPEEASVVPVKSFDIENGIPLKEAVFALDYVDHDFFLFKNEETGKPSVVYKRNAGGIGLIEI
eukprot:CAMPEP_0117039278 /NCGR_PEP_ID=MMETSP0472-20121206/27585_1 /TAXON_ID=693140 ORGANISM="Tiarina fusus, Strain LIS" /NCGR_SAMPLE_ID=MMETSP0472 /ASSEMBLY_ACC=CAM_ASM_000603 /LENGTH=230 /DNA_ID=CAMNT_0004749741 /DNA_START=98 /DNA_END=790 /DNA_ORIENTATION=+